MQRDDRLRNRAELSIRPYGTYNNWASEASPTLGCSIEISRDIYIYVLYGCPTLPGYATGRPVA